MNRKRIIKMIILFTPLLFVVLTCGRLFILANNTIFSAEPEMAPGWVKMVTGFTKSNHLALDRLQTNLSMHTSHTESLETVKLPPFVDYCDANCPGENGTAVIIKRENLKSEEEKARFDQGLELNAFNQYVSDMISVHRRLPDCRSHVCRKLVDNFQGALPEISVVITFYNEAWTALLRSVHSVIDRTPAHLLKQIILVDDNSTFEFLKTPLDKYFSSFPVVQIIHSPRRLGLIKARLVGFEASVAPVVVFLDSHIECFPGWAEPMLVRIFRNQKTVVYPLIADILKDTFKLECLQSMPEYCSFNWKYLQIEWEVIPKRVLAMRRDESDSIRSPAMPGGLFAIHREFFQQLGTYDPDLVFWGGENMELSFKTWMCGGSLEMDPCSTVGHIFRSTNPHRVQYPQLVVTRNAHRVAEVWMDDYKNYYYERNNYQSIDVGNITDRLQLRASLQCKSFEWYLKHVTPDKPYPHSQIYAGVIQSKADSRCLMNQIHKETPKYRPVLCDCKWRDAIHVWYMGASAHIHQDHVFLCVDDGTVVLHELQNCKESQSQWQYREEKWLYHIATGQCLTIAADSHLVLSPCTDSGLQLWHFQKRRSDLKFPSYL